MPRQRFQVVQPTTQPDDRQTPLAEVMAGLIHGLRELGHEADGGLNAWRGDARPVVLFPHLLTDARLAALPADAILYNVEPIDPFGYLPPSRLGAFAGHRVWDYSPRNLPLWREVGIAAHHLPVAWHPGLTRIAPAPARDIDVLFYGAPTDRRLAILRALAARGIAIKAVVDAYGAELDALLARSRLVLNLHAREGNELETVRISLPLANGIPVLSEPVADPSPPYDEIVCWATAEAMADACVRLLDDDTALRALGHRAAEAMRAHPLTPRLAEALAIPAPTAAPSTALGRRRRIPPILHVVWVGDPSRRPDAQIDTWRRHHPDATLRVWDNEALARTAWINHRHMNDMARRELAGVADLMRWEILFREGGIAIDADSTCLRPLPDWLFDCEMFAAWENELARPGLIANGTVGSTPANPFLMHLIHDIRRQESLAGRMAWQATGPLALTEAHRRHRYANLTLLPSHFFTPRHFTGVSYEGGGPVYAEQDWASTRALIDQNR